MNEPSATKLSPLRKRLLVFAVLVVIALGSIWLIDRRAMERMREHEQQQRSVMPTLNESADSADEAAD